MSSLTLTIIQSNLHWENKAANLAMFHDKIEGIKEKTEIVLLPEMFSTGFSMKPESLAETMDGQTVAWMKNMAAEKKIIITGSVIIRENEQYFNRLLWVLPTGESGYYDKRHLFAYAKEDNFYAAGCKRLIASAKGWKINLMICYDLRFPVWSRQTRTGPEYDMLIYVANWPQSRIQAWRKLLPARAIENQCYVVGLNRVGRDGNDIYYNGESMIIDPLGEVLYQKSDEEDIFTFTFEKQRLKEIRSKFPFLKDADNFLIEP
jgi:omega-amidase